MRKRRYSREDALDRWLFADIYTAALRISDPELRLIATTFLLLTGRLKMRVSEAMHFHEGWLRRKYGLIEIPAFEPCLCKYCYQQAESNHGSKDPYDSVEERMLHERYRTKNKRKRFVPISWSPRIVAAIEAYIDEIGVYPNRDRTATRLLQEHILPNAELLEPGDVDWRGMRATGDTFWAFSGLNTKARAEIGGHRETELGTYSGASPIGLTNQVRQAQGLAPLELPTHDPVTHPPNPHPREPFEDPRKIDPLKNYDPLQRAPVFNPRSEEVPAEVDITKDDFDILALDKQQPSLEEIRGVVARYESQLEGSIEDAPTDPLKESYESETHDSLAPGQSLLDEYPTGDDRYEFRAETPFVTFTRGYVSYSEAAENQLTELWLQVTDRNILPTDDSTVKRATVSLSLVMLTSIIILTALTSGTLSTGSASSDLFGFLIGVYTTMSG